MDTEEKEVEDHTEDLPFQEPRPHHPWKVRFYVGMIMLVLGFIGLIVTDVAKNGAWNYWKIAAPVFALLSLWLSWYLRRKKHRVATVTFWHEILHWLGLILAVYLTSFFVGAGILGRFEAGLDILTLLALTMFLAGIYIESSFLLIGLVLGFFAVGIALFSEYLYGIMIPVVLIGALAIFLMARFQSKDLKDGSADETSRF